MKKLEEIILDRIDDRSLYNLNNRYPSLRIDEEWKRRLLSCDAEIYMPVLDLFEKENVIKTQVLKKALYDMRKCFPWRIGVVYDFRNGHVKSLEIRLGNNNSKYRFETSPLLFTWLDVNESKKLLREVISSNSKSSIFSEKLDSEQSDKVRDLLLDNRNIDVEVSILKAVDRPFYTFPRASPLPGGEDYVVYPTRIKKGEKEVVLLKKDNTQTVSYKNVPIKFSDEVRKYISVISI